MWRMQAEHSIEQLGLQLRASQHENQRLRQERQELMEALEKKESSRYATPEEKTAGIMHFEIEDGAAAQKGRKTKEVGQQPSQLERCRGWGSGPARSKDSGKCGSSPARQKFSGGWGRVPTRRIRE